MKHYTIATLLIAALASSTGLLAQNAYRCGSSYSQIPCPDGVPIEAKDARSKAQAMQNAQITKRDASAANALERSRLKDEALASGAPVAKERRESNHNKTTPTKSKTKKKKEPEFFSAHVIPKENKKTKEVEKSGATTK